MVYDNTKGQPDYSSNERGYAIHQLDSFPGPDYLKFEIYTDDGRGNGDYVATTSDVFWARQIAHALDNYYGR